MGYPRSQLVVSGAVGTYHCVSRCVRRAFLCGEDALTGRSFEHRKGWIEDRLIELAEVFSVSLLAYAVMSNHVHVVLRVDPNPSLDWSDREVAERWVRLFPARVEGVVDAEACRAKADVLCGNAERIAQLRARLADLSWFMRCLSEPLARLANAEDGCTGRFWEGRFRSQALLDDAAVLACMAYVDLNPVRAGAADDLPGSHHTSAQRRVQDPPERQNLAINAVAGVACPGFLPLCQREYIELVDWVGRELHPGKRGRIRASCPPALASIERPSEWVRQVRGIETRFCRAVGSAVALLEKAKEIGQRWLMVRRTERALV